MIRRNGKSPDNSLPQSGIKERKMTTPAEDNNVVRLAGTHDLVEFEAWQEELREDGINFRVHRGRFTSSIKWPNAVLEIWVLGGDLVRAQAVLTRLAPPGK